MSVLCLLTDVDEVIILTQMLAVTDIHLLSILFLLEYILYMYVISESFFMGNTHNKTNF